MSIPFYPDLSELRANIPNTEIAVTQPVTFTPPPPVSEWTWANQGTAVAYDDPAGIKFVIGPDDAQPRLIFILGDIPDTPYTITMAGSSGLAVVLLDDVSGNFILSSGGSVSYWDDPGTFSSAPQQINVSSSYGGLNSSVSWSRLKDDGINLIASNSTDGLFFVDVTIVSRTAFIVPTKCGISMFPAGSFPPLTQVSQPYLLNFEITTP